MSDLALALLTALLGALKSRRNLVLENLALRHQLAVLASSDKRPRFRLADPLWGAPRIHGELLKLGLDISESIVSRWMPRSRKTPSPSWRAFLENHAGDLVLIGSIRRECLDHLIVLNARLCLS